jgi:hypothetical protein
MPMIKVLQNADVFNGQVQDGFFGLPKRKAPHIGTS